MVSLLCFHTFTLIHEINPYGFSEDESYWALRGMTTARSHTQLFLYLLFVCTVIYLQLSILPSLRLNSIQVPSISTMETFSSPCDLRLYEVGSTENLRLQDFPQVCLQNPKLCRGGHSSSSQANHLKVMLS